MGVWASDFLEIDDIYHVLDVLKTDPRRACDATGEPVYLLPAKKNSTLRGFEIIRVHGNCDAWGVKSTAFISQKLVGEVERHGKRWRVVSAKLLTYHNPEMKPPEGDHSYSEDHYEDVDFLLYARCFDFIE